MSNEKWDLDKTPTLPGIGEYRRDPAQSTNADVRGDIDQIRTSIEMMAILRAEDHKLRAEDYGEAKEFRQEIRDVIRDFRGDVGSMRSEVTEALAIAERRLMKVEEQLNSRMTEIELTVHGLQTEQTRIKERMGVMKYALIGLAMISVGSASPDLLKLLLPLIGG